MDPREFREFAAFVAEQFNRVFQRLDRIEARLDRVEERLDRIEVRLDRVEERLDRVVKRLDRVEERLDRGEERLTRVEVLQESMRGDLQLLAEAQMSNVARIAGMEERLERVDGVLTIRFAAHDLELESIRSKIEQVIENNERLDVRLASIEKKLSVA